MGFLDRVLRGITQRQQARRSNSSVSAERGLTTSTAVDSSEEEEEEIIEGWYMSGLQYGRDVGAMIFGVDEATAEDLLTEFLSTTDHYNPAFYGLGEIDHNGEPLDEIIEVNL